MRGGALVIIPATTIAARSLIRAADPTGRGASRRVRCAEMAKAAVPLRWGSFVTRTYGLTLTPRIVPSSPWPKRP